eukprot:EG_transcript_16635
MAARSLHTMRVWRGLSRRCFAAAADLGAVPIKPSRSINWFRHWKGGLLTTFAAFLVSDVVYENTFVGTTIRTIAESPTKWLNPKKIGEALDNAFMTVEKTYLAERPAHLRGRPTLCVNLNGCIVSTVYDAQAKRWVTYKRPGLDMFLERMSEKYELVVWSSSGLDNAMDVVSRLDPEHLYFHDTISKEVEHPGAEKDLQHLGRPLQRVVVLDTKPNADEKYRHNTIVIPEWKGAVERMSKDRTLYNVLPFMDHLASQQQVFDLPRLIAAYNDYAEKEGKCLPFAFLELMEKKRAERPFWKFW